VVQMARFSEDGSRKITRVTEAVGLNEANQYVLQDLFASHVTGRTPAGQLVTSLDATGCRPSFAPALREQGLDELVRLTRPLWSD
jgi:pilus assembly protein CpaF